MTLFFFVLHALAMIMIILVPLTIFKMVTKAAKPKFVSMPDIEYKVKVGVAKRYLKSKGISCA